MPGKKFIAGAVCPGCGQLDKIYLVEEQGRKMWRCIHCGRTDQTPTAELITKSSN